MKDCNRERMAPRKSGRFSRLASLAMLAFGLFFCTAGIGFAATGGASSAAHSEYSPTSVIPSATSGTPSGTQGVVRAASAGSHGTLPFTGLSLVAVVLVGGGLVVLGFALRRRAIDSPGDRG